MKYKVLINTPEEAWLFIRRMYSSYHRHLKQFGYGYEMFIPPLQSINDFFDDESHFQKIQKGEFRESDIAAIKEDFLRYYSVEHFEDAFSFFQQNVIPQINDVLPELQKMQDNWGMNIPKKITVSLTYGLGGSYHGDKNNPRIILRSTDMNLHQMATTSIHEFLHICIEEDIIQKYNVPQDIKEQIVDVICVDYLKTQEHKQRFNTPGLSKFINAQSVVDNLPKAVEELKEHLTN